MFFKLKSNFMFRDFESFGYITDKRNFGYKQSDNNDNHVGDKILSESGAVFMSILGREPQTIDELAKKIETQFTDVDIRTIKDDAKEFYCMLELDGFIVSGKTKQECTEKDTKFSYKILEPASTNKISFENITHPEKSTLDFLDEFFKGKPQLTNLHIEITSLCNERCLHCYIPHDYKISYMESDLFYNILRQCKDMRLLHLTISGGEPMLHKNFVDFLRKCNGYNLSVNVLSNLTLLNDEIINEMKANPLLDVQVSLYSIDSNIHD